MGWWYHRIFCQFDWNIYSAALSNPKFPYSPAELASELMKGSTFIFMTLHERMKKNKFGYPSSNLVWKIWGLANDWEALIIHNPDHQNANKFSMQWYYDIKYKTRRWCVIYTNKSFAWVIWALEDKARNEKTTYWWRDWHNPQIEGSLRIHILAFWQALICFNPMLKSQRFVLMMVLCVNLLKRLTLAWVKRYLPTPLGNGKVHHRSLSLQMISQKAFGNHGFSWTLSGLYLDFIGGIPQNKDGNPLPLVGFWAHFDERISHKIFWLIIYKISEQQWTFQFPNRKGRHLFIRSGVGLFNRFIHSSIIKAICWHFSIGLKQIRVSQNARIWIWTPYGRRGCCYV